MAALLFGLATVTAFSQSVTLKHCVVQAVDTTNMTITVKQGDQGDSMVLYVTSRTRLFRNGEPAIVAEFQAGDTAFGTACRTPEKRVEAVRVYARSGSLKSPNGTSN